MIRNFKALGLALLAVFALGAIAAQGASAAHKFISDGAKTIVTGENVGVYTMSIGEVGTIECKKYTSQSTGVATENETVSVVPQYSECSFGGQPATVNVHHCYHVLNGTTTSGNTTGGEHANIEIKCDGAEQAIAVHTVNCTITIPPQVIKHAVRYENELGVNSATRAITTAHAIKVNKSRNTASQPLNGCLTFPPNGSEVGKLTGTTTNKCFRDEREKALEGTEQTTPPATVHGPTTECSVKGAPTV